MGGKFRPLVIAASAVALLVIASPVAALTGPLAAQHVAAAPKDAKPASKGNDHDAKAAPQVTAPEGPASAEQDSAAPATAPPQLSPTQPVATRPATANGVGTRSLPAQIELSRPRTGQPSERADHASARSPGRHVGAGPDTDAPDTDATGTSSPSLTASTTIASSGTPAAGTQAATTSPTVSRAATNNPGGTSTPPPVAVVPPAAPQTNPPLSTQPALTGTRLDWILVGVVVALAAAVVAAVRMATLRGRRPPR